MMKLKGQERFLARLETLEKSAPQIAAESLQAGLAVTANACRAVSPAGVAGRIETRVTVENGIAVGRVTLRPKPGSRGSRRSPNQYRKPQFYLSKAIRGSRAAASKAMARVAKAKIRETAEGR